MSKALRFKLLPAMAALLVSACSVSPELKTPPAPEASAYTKESELVSLDQKLELGNRIAGDWWSLFSSKPLDALIRQAVHSNHDLETAGETMKQAQEAANAADGNLMPQVALNAAAGRQRYGVAMFGPSNFSIPPFSYYEIGPTISWVPDLFGATRHAVDRQKALAAYQAHRFDAAYLSLTGDTVAATLEMASANDELAALQRILANDEKMLALVEHAGAVGTASSTDVLNAKTRLLADRALLPVLKSRLSASHHALAILLGRSPSEWAPPRLGLSDFSLPKSIPLSLPSELVKNRPDIRAAQANLDAAGAALGVASANLYPNLVLSANMLQEALTPAGLFQGAAKTWAFAAGLSAPIFDGGTLSAQKREAGHAYNAALASYQQVILNAFGEVADALTSLAGDDESVRTQQGTTDAAGKALEIALNKYRVGEIGLMQ
ncbi:MAG: efflux transporter outer membrane subunit, partial [Betaproteobacteria bacterium]|nr:efflux transporter outer membrane subunit [Betaproteobacteria bacterium]